MRKPTFSTGENEDEDQLRGNGATVRSASLISLQRDSWSLLGLKGRTRMEKPINLISVTNIHWQARACE